MEFRVLIVLFSFSAILSSCTKEVNIDIPGYEEKVVIDGRIETGMPPIVLISKTQDIYSPTTLDAFLNSFQSGAIVTVSDGTTTVVLDEICSDNLPPGTEAMAAALFGISEAELANYHICAYSSFNPAIFGQVGKTYSLKVELNGETFTSSTQIVNPRPLNTVYWEQDPGGNPGYGYSWANLSDPAGEYNAYLWEVKRINMVDGATKDPNFKTTFSPVINDEFFNGQTFNFFYENPFTWDDNTVASSDKGYYKQGDSVAIKFSTMDANVYEFLEKKYMQLQTAGNPFAAPTSIPTNIQGGALGLWAGYSPSFDTLYCIP
ncbi:DUF4249 domain-containing protein [Fluviicola taffensis]|uniref:DUF4249 domain-containing protein n=1 Tax=Fluviicola taffensis (strain DSM 16823 / NCIMB 13979 / RW262) TaxID=755732 RepID=F2IA89_FLUTR|nr:DUF4249 domain-containing protein [Fluviicola taffensis]AEA45266.1 hypothetical protein Fluta_3294 [Fluviicola taffensis DSM 16823]